MREVRGVLGPSRMDEPDILARMWWGAALLGVLAGCAGSQSAQCPDGRVCAEGTVCAAALDLCVAPGQIAACAGAADGVHCMTNGTCSHGVCVSAHCGNGVVEPGEACDDGNTISGDGCSADCRSTEVCGNGIIDPAEQCDCGAADDVSAACPGPNSDASGPCGLDCRLRCGDGVVSSDEACDPGASAAVSCAGVASFDRGLTTCSASCQPVVAAGCRYIGWRGESEGATAIALTSTGNGFYLIDTLPTQVGQLVAYLEAGSVVTAPRPLAAIWAGDGAALAVGEAGTIVHLTTTWATYPAVTQADLHGVWGRSHDDIYAIGDATVLHWDGATWSPLTPPAAGTFRAVAGDAGHVYVAGDGGTLLVFDGVTWQVAATGTSADLDGVWSIGTLVVAVGKHGTIVQDDGTGWVSGRTTATDDLLSVWGDPSADQGLFAVGARGTLLFYDLHVWRPLAVGRGVTASQDQTFRQVTGIPAGDVVAVGTEDVIKYEGAAWSPTSLPVTETIDGLWGDAPDDVFAVGREGTILHHDGLTWTAQAAPTTVDLHAVWGTGPDDVYAAGDDLTLIHYDGVAWTTVHTGVGILRAVFASGSVFTAGTTGIFEDDVQTSMVPEQAAWGTSATDVWFGGVGGVVHDDGDGFSAVDPIDVVAGLSGTSSSDVYAVGSTAHHFDGTQWLPGPFDEPLSAVSASAQRGVFAVGAAGKLRHWDGAAVEPFISRTTTDLNAVLVTGNVVFMAGVDGTLDILVFND